MEDKPFWSRECSWDRWEVFSLHNFHSCIHTRKEHHKRGRKTETDKIRRGDLHLYNLISLYILHKWYEWHIPLEGRENLPAVHFFWKRKGMITEDRRWVSLTSVIISIPWRVPSLVRIHPAILRPALSTNVGSLTILHITSNHLRSILWCITIL